MINSQIGIPEREELAQNSIDCEVGLEPGRLTWSPDTAIVTLYRISDTIGGDRAETIIFSQPASSIKKSVIANASTTLILTLTDATYELHLEIESISRGLSMTRLFGPVAFVAGMATASIKSRHDGLYRFQDFLKAQGVQTKRSSMLRIIVATVGIFILVIAALITVVLMFY